MGKQELILLTGATGYIGGRLLKSLESAGRRVRCLTRRPDSLRSKVAGTAEVVAGDVLDPACLEEAMAGVHSAYYLVHSMGSEGSFEEEDRRAAINFGNATREAGVQRIIYVGGLGDSSDELSAHLRSRHEVGEILRSSGVPVIEFRTSIVIGSGSLSFEMVRALAERLPVMTAPRWVRVPAQPIAIDDLISYLLAALDFSIKENRIFEIGGSDHVSYGDLIHEYARQRGLKRLIIPVPVLTPRLSSLWLGLVTPLYSRVGRKLIDSIRHATVVRDRSALDHFSVRPVGVREAIAAALRSEDQEMVEKRWFDGRSPPVGIGRKRIVRHGSRLLDSRVVVVQAPPEKAFGPIRRIGGANGWYYANWLWWLRGVLDLLVGGIGLRQSRRDPEHLSVGDAVDCWRVTALEPNRRLVLTCEMKLPGRAWLEFEVQPEEHGTAIRQTAMYDPIGLLGLAYWCAVYPLHELVFAGMLRAIAKRAACESVP